MSSDSTNPPWPDPPHFWLESAIDLFSPNLCLNLEPAPVDGEPVRLSGVNCVVETLIKRRQFAWQRAVEAITLALPGCKPSLKPWVCTSEVKPDSPAGRWHGKKAFKDFPGAAGAAASCSQQVRTPDGFLQYCAAFQMEHEAVVAAEAFPELLKSTFLCWLPQGRPPDLGELIKVGWRGDLYDHEAFRQIAIIVVRWGGVLVRLFGCFDDIEAGASVVLDAESWPCFLEAIQPWLDPARFR